MLTNDICRGTIQSHFDISTNDTTRDDIATIRERCAEMEERMERMENTKNMENMENMATNTLQGESTQEANMRKEPAKKKGWTAVAAAFLIVLAFLAIQLVISTAWGVISMVQFAVKAGGDMAAATEAYTDYMMNSGIQTIILLVVYIVCSAVGLLWYKKGYVKKYTQQMRADFKERVLQVRTIVTLVLAGIGCYCIAVLISSLVAYISPGSMELYNFVMGSALSGDAVVAFITTVILAPIAEELFFRGIIIRKLLSSNGVTAAIVIQAVLFGLYHLNPLQFFFVLPLGIVMGYAAYKLNSVIPCILIHAVNNFMPYVVSALPEKMRVIGVFLVAAVICCGLILLLNRKAIGAKSHA